MLQELYQELILDHNKSPRNRRAMQGANRQSDGHNPLCGDQIHVYLHLDGGTISDVSFEGHGCACAAACHGSAAIAIAIAIRASECMLIFLR